MPNPPPIPGLETGNNSGKVTGGVILEYNNILYIGAFNYLIKKPEN